MENQKTKIFVLQNFFNWPPGTNPVYRSEVNTPIVTFSCSLSCFVCSGSAQVPSGMTGLTLKTDSRPGSRFSVLGRLNFFQAQSFFSKNADNFWTRTTIRSGQVEHCEPPRLISFMFVVFGVCWADVLGAPMHAP
jgi:hypothetical protein